MIKQFVLLLSFFLVSFNFSNAQFSFGLNGGVSTSDLGDGQLIINKDELDMYRLKVEEARYGIHLGAFAIIEISQLFLMPEIVFNSTRLDYSILDHNEIVENVLQEDYLNLDLSLMMGYKAGPFRLGLGPVAHRQLNHSSDLWELQGYNEELKKLTWGWQGGIGLDVAFVHIDVRYEGNFNKVGDHMLFFGEKYYFDKSPSRWIGRIGISF